MHPLLASLLIFAAFPAGVAFAADAPATPAKPAKPAKTAKTAKPKEAAAVVEDGATPVAAMNAASLLPIGIPSYNVRMPEFEEDRLVSRMRVAKLIRFDANLLDLNKMHLERFRNDGRLDFVITVQRGFYDMQTGRLTSSSPTRVRGEDIDMYGQGCDYAKEADVIKILGNVTSYLYLKEEKKKEPGNDAPPVQGGAAPAPTKQP